MLTLISPTTSSFLTRRAARASVVINLSSVRSSSLSIFSLLSNISCLLSSFFLSIISLGSVFSTILFKSFFIACTSLNSTMLDTPMYVITNTTKLDIIKPHIFKVFAIVWLKRFLSKYSLLYSKVKYIL